MRSIRCHQQRTWTSLRSLGRPLRASNSPPRPGEGELHAVIHECWQVFHSSIGRAAKRLGDHPQTNVPTFAHLTRRISLFSILFASGDSLLQYLNMHIWKAKEIGCNDPPKGACDRVMLRLAAPDAMPSMWPPGRPRWWGSISAKASSKVAGLCLSSDMLVSISLY
jgi:hypothetical protein